ncbi:MAG: hypothetical protein D6826_03255 [Alphaproteobacteria bacterium]|nr:MAG: hypothetical protein D6826_03255 [Alphaproteobacteria bacterium]
MQRQFVFGLAVAAAIAATPAGLMPVGDVLAHDQASPGAGKGEDGHHDDGDARSRLARGARMLRARDLYEAQCASCHGTDGTGTTTTVDFTTPEAVARLTRDAMVASVIAGHDPDVAGAWSGVLGEAAIADVVDYVREALMLPAPVADASIGRRIYARTCSVCHGERGNAASWAKNSLDPPPFDFTSDKARQLSRQDMIRYVTYGRDGTAMMPFATQLTRSEIAAVVDYIRRAFISADAPTAETAAADARSQSAEEHAAHGHRNHGGGDIDAPFPAGIVGDFAAGKKFYEKNCAECHGPNGTGDGRRAYFMRKKPENFTSAEARAELNRPHLLEAIAKGVRGTEMPAWSKVITIQQIADVAEYVFQRFIHPDAGAMRTGEGEDTGARAGTSPAPAPADESAVKKN